MKRLLASSAVALALLAPVSAHATGTKTYDFCGGSYSGYTGFAFCASVVVSVAPATNADGLTHAAGAYTVNMDITNKSGTNGSYVNSLFIQVGLDNLNDDIAVPANVRVMQGSTVICTNVLDTSTGKTNCYDVQEDKKAAGGIRLDFLASATNGVSKYPIASCTATVTGLHTCPTAGPVRISFDVKTDFDPNNGVQVYVKGQGQLGSTECETPVSSVACTMTPPPVVSTPEPATLALLGTGLAGLGPMVFRRRRRNGTAE